MNQPPSSRSYCIAADPMPTASLRKLLTIAAILVAWMVSLCGLWWGMRHQSSPDFAQMRASLARALATQAAQKQRIHALEQTAVNYELSDRISRRANDDVQATLAERDQQIAALRAEVAFYERLVGSTAPRQSLNVHSLGFTPGAKNTWNYRMLLSQNLIRGAVSRGQMQFSVQGVRAGQLVVLGWGSLHQVAKADEKPYAFRYFQQLEGDIILPKDFIPQHVTVSLTGQDGGVIRQTLSWKIASSADEGED